MSYMNINARVVHQPKPCYCPNACKSSSHKCLCHKSTKCYAEIHQCLCSTTQKIGWYHDYKECYKDVRHVSFNKQNCPKHKYNQ